MPGMTRLTTIAALITLVLAAAPSATAADGSLTIDLGKAGEGGLHISVSGDWLTKSILESLSDSIECDGEKDPEARKMLLHLRKKGEGSKYTLREKDEVTEARRRNGRLEILKHEPGEKPTRVVLPWAMGECMLGNAEPMRKLGDDFEMTIEKDGQIRLQID